MQGSEDINILQNRISELELENKNLHETVAYPQKGSMKKDQKQQKPLE